MKVVIYVLCYNDQTEATARAHWGMYDWARVYRLKRRTELFEGVMYEQELMDLEDEWKDADYVGTIAYSYLRKYPHNKDYLLTKLATLSGDFVGLIEGETNPYYTTDVMRGYMETLIRQAGFKVSPTQSWVFANYWCCPPSVMKTFIRWFNAKWLPLLYALPNVWDDANHNSPNRPTDAELTLNVGKPYYPYHPFLTERIVSVYFDALLTTNKMSSCRPLFSRQS
jgi:hypothetical protein